MQSIVHGGIIHGLDAPDRFDERFLVVGQGLDRSHLGVESDHAGGVFWAHQLHEGDGRLPGRFHLVSMVHAAALVNDQDGSDRTLLASAADVGQ